LKTNEACSGIITQLEEYFGERRRIFDIKTFAQGTEFQKRVWEQIAKIPYGETRSYADIAVALGDPKSVRAVGGASGANPILIVIPCHRELGSDNSLTGFAGGVEIKRALLELEGAPGFQPRFDFN